MDKKDAIIQLENFISDCKEFVSVEPTENDVQALEISLASLKETAQEVPVQEQLLKINRNIKFTQFSVIVCSLFTIIGHNLFFYRFNESIQRITDILNNNVSITRTILDFIQTITNIFINI